MKYVIMILTLSAGLILTAQRGPGGAKHHPYLTDSQRQQIHELVRSMEERGVDKWEIQQAVEDKLAVWGIDMPDDFLQRMGKGYRPHRIGDPPEFMKQLSQEQKDEIHSLVQMKRDNGESPEEIRTAVHSLLDSWGIEHGEDVGLRHGPGRFMMDLSDSQREEIQNLVKDLQEKGTPPDEIHAAVGDLLESWGLDRPEFHSRKEGKRGHHFMEKLNGDQRDKVHDLILRMRQGGASRKEIHESIKDLLDRWGIDADLPEEGDMDAKTGDERDNAVIEAQNYPNPFNPSTRISYNLKSPGNVNISVYDVTGKLVRELTSGYRSAGLHSIEWDGTNQAGASVPSGMYYYKITSKDGIKTESMILLK